MKIRVGTSPFLEHLNIRYLACFVLIISGLFGMGWPAHASPAEAEVAYARGDLTRSLKLWRRATASDDAQVDRFTAWIRIAELERALGRPEAGRVPAQQAIVAAGAVGDTGRLAAARGVLGGLLFALGDAEHASQELQRAESEARHAGAKGVLGAVLLARAQLLSVQSPGLAQPVYEEVAALARQRGDTALEFEAWLDHGMITLRGAEAKPRSVPEIDRARALAGSLGPTHPNRLARVRLARALAIQAAAADPALASALRTEAQQGLAAVLAEAPRDGIAASWALGVRAGLQRAEGDPEAAIGSARVALRAARKLRLPEAELEWEALLGRLLRETGDSEAAFPHLQRAAERLAERRAASPFHARAGTSASEVFRDVVELRLDRAGAMSDPALQQGELRAAQRMLEQFKAAELRDHFENECVDAFRQKRRATSEIATTAAVVYPIVLPDRLEVLVSVGDEVLRTTSPVSSEQLRATTLRLRQLLVKRTTRQFLAASRELYGWLVAPALAALGERETDTLVFVPDGVLRTIPMAALHDGESFLIERYAVAVTPGLELTDPRPLDLATTRAFVGGLSVAREGFAALPQARDELAHVAKATGAEPVLDEAFTKPRILETLATEEFGVVHLATHGVFGATPAETFLVTHDGRLGLGPLAEAVGGYRFRETPLEILLLSACETAAGDEQAALGLSGVAIQSGARSAFGSLWSVSDQATRVIVEALYAELAKPGRSRARALQLAQQSLLTDPRYAHPFYWAPFLLIGSWL